MNKDKTYYFKLTDLLQPAPYSPDAGPDTYMSGHYKCEGRHEWLVSRYVDDTLHTDDFFLVWNHFTSRKAMARKVVMFKDEDEMRVEMLTSKLYG